MLAPSGRGRAPSSPAGLPAVGPQAPALPGPAIARRSGPALRQHPQPPALWSSARKAATAAAPRRPRSRTSGPRQTRRRQGGANAQP
eukprot:3095412-Alexandrium_andersonii.AAC.1